MQDSKVFEPKQVLENEVNITAADTLEVYETVALVTLTLDTSFTLTLPNVSQARGRWYSISIVATGGGSAVLTVAAGADSSVAYSDTIEDAGDSILAYSDGRRWHIVKQEAD